MKPHASDGLARLFRDSEAWRGLGTWYSDYSQSHWACIDWSLAEFGRMFPSTEDPPDVVADLMLNQVLNPTSLGLVSLASDRSSAWRPDDGRSAIRERRGLASHPLERRSLALAALAIGEDVPIIRQMLGEFEENAVTLAMLEARSWRPMPVKADYAGR